MRRLVLESSTEDISRVLGKSLLKINSLETLVFLKADSDEVAMVCRVDLKDGVF